MPAQLMKDLDDKVNNKLAKSSSSERVEVKTRSVAAGLNVKNGDEIIAQLFIHYPYGYFYVDSYMLGEASTDPIYVDNDVKDRYKDEDNIIFVIRDIFA